MKENTIHINSVSDYPAAAKEFAASMGANRIYAFYGGMGAGKTTFIKAVCEELGVDDAVNSPTFAIVNEYATADAETVYHFDFYRIKNIGEVYNMGYEEYLYSGAYVFMEWPELVEELLPEETVRVYIDENPDGTRTIKYKTASN